MVVLSGEHPLAGHRILLAVTGSVAACRADRIIRALQEDGAEVQVLITEAGREFFTPQTAGSLTSLPVIQGQFDPDNPGAMVHIDAKQQTDCVLVAPATANRVLQLESPRADDALGTVLQSFHGPVLYAPAMNPDMWEHPDLQEVVARHRDRVILPESDRVACGEWGAGHLRDPDVIAEHVTRRVWPNPLEGAHWVVSGGPTREPWDAIRFLSNRSSGRMGEALALIGVRLGARVDLVTGATQRFYRFPQDRCHAVETTAEMLERVQNLMHADSGYLGAAAVSDYRPRTRTGKVKSGQTDQSIPLERNPDILTRLRESHPEATLVGFSADDREGPERALKKARSKGLDAVIFNSIRQVDGGFGQRTNRAVFALPDGTTLSLGHRPKRELAVQIWLTLIRRSLHVATRTAMV